MESMVWESEISAAWPKFLDDHRIGGTPVMPAAAFAMQALLAAASQNVELRDFTISEPLAVSAAATMTDERKTVQVILAAEGSIHMYSRAAEATSWTLHARGKLRESSAAAPTMETADSIRARCPESISGEEFYAQALQRQMQFGPAFQRIDRLWRGDREALCLFRMTSADKEANTVGLIDACFQLAAAARSSKDEEDNSGGYEGEGESLARCGTHGRRKNAVVVGQNNWMPSNGYFDPYFERIHTQV